MKSVYFHEDNYCQIELVPLQNVLSTQIEFQSTKNSLKESFDGQGFLNITSKQQLIYPLSTLNINNLDLENSLKEYYLFHFENVYNGYGDFKQLKSHIHGFGFENYVLYYESKDNIIQKLWIDYNLLSDTLNIYPQMLQNALIKLGNTYDLILVDWNELRTIFLRNNTSIIDYITEVL